MQNSERYIVCELLVSTRFYYLNRTNNCWDRVQSLGITAEFEFKIIWESGLILGSSATNHHLPPPICLKPRIYTPPFAPPLCWGMWARSVASPTRIPAPLPSPEGCGWLIIARRRIWGMRNIMGDLGSRRPGVSWKQATTYVMVHFLSFFLPQMN